MAVTTMDLQEEHKKILKELVVSAKQFQKELQKLLSDGIDRERYICLKDMADETESDLSYTFLERNMVIDMLFALEERIEEHEMLLVWCRKLSGAVQGEFSVYDQFAKMVNLVDKDWELMMELA